MARLNKWSLNGAKVSSPFGLLPSKYGFWETLFLAWCVYRTTKHKAYFTQHKCAVKFDWLTFLFECNICFAHLYLTFTIYKSNTDFKSFQSIELPLSNISQKTEKKKKCLFYWNVCLGELTPVVCRGTDISLLLQVQYYQRSQSDNRLKQRHNFDLDNQRKSITCLKTW